MDKSRTTRYIANTGNYLVEVEGVGIPNDTDNCEPVLMKRFDSSKLIKNNYLIIDWCDRIL